MMNILFVSPFCNPFDGVGWGSIQRTNLLLEACAQIGHVDVVSFVDNVQATLSNCEVIYSKSDAENHQNESRLTKFVRLLTPWREEVMFPCNTHRSNVVRSIVVKKDYDLIVCRYIPSAMECGLYDYADRLVIDVDDNPVDVERTAARTSRTWRNRLYHRIRSVFMNRVVKKIQNKCHFTFFANPAQAISNNSAYLPNIPFYEIQLPLVDFKATTPRLLFVGNMSYGPNSQGMNHFVKNIFPLVCAQVPNAELHLVGGCNQERYINAWNKIEGVQYMGFVDDLTQEYTTARVTIVPIYGGAGTNIKVLETMQMRRPCVTTIYGKRGFEQYLTDGKELFISHTDAEFADYAVRLLTEEPLNHSMATDAHDVIEKNFTRKAFNRIVKDSLC